MGFTKMLKKVPKKLFGKGGIGGKMADIATSGGLGGLDKIANAAGIDTSGLKTGLKEAAFGTPDQWSTKPSIYSPQQEAAMDQLGNIGTQGLMGTLGQFQQNQLNLPQYGGFNGLGGESGTEKSGGGFWQGLAGLGGGALGAFLGGPTGAAIGAKAGTGLFDWLNETAADSNRREGKNQQPEMTYEQALQQLGGPAPQNQFDFSPIAQREMTRFNQETIPSIASKFSSLGTGGSQRSSGFAQTLGQAGSNFGEGLASLGQQYGLQNFQANENARQNQQQAAMQFLANQQGYKRSGQQLGQNQQNINLQNKLGMGQLGLGQQRNNLASTLGQQSAYENLMGLGLQPRKENAFMAGKQGFLGKGTESLAQYAGPAMMKALFGV